MRKIKLTVKITAALLAIAIPFLSVLFIAFVTEPEFENHYANALGEKMDRLMEIKKDKIVIVGGSSVAFGYDSRIIEEYTGMPVVNFGMYAALGTKLMLDLSRPGIKKGDIVIVAPELDAQTLSMFFSPSMTHIALDGYPEYLRYVDSEHTLAMLAASWDFASEKLAYKISGAPDPDGIYNSKNFNKYGDLQYPREENIMDIYFEPNSMINLTRDIVDKEFIDYLNDYIDYCEDVGATVYFEFCPMNALGVESDGEQIAEFEAYLREELDCMVLAAGIEDYIYEAGYFYDTNFHLNEAGVIKHTVNVTEDLLLELGIPKAVKIEVPAAPPLPEREVKFFGEDENAKYFEYEKQPNGSYAIVGVKEAYLDRKELTVPLGYNGYKVSAIGEGAFSGSEVEKLIITEDTNLTILMNGCFEGAGRLSELWIYYPYEENLLPPKSFSGVASSFKVYVPEGAGYEMGYYWSERGLDFEYID